MPLLESVANRFVEARKTVLGSFVILALLSMGAIYTAKWAGDDPSTDRPIKIVTLLTGAKARRIDAEITRPIVNELRRWVKDHQIKAISEEGVSEIRLSFLSPAQRAVLNSEIERALNSLAPRLPKEISGPYLYFPSGLSIDLLIALSGDGFESYLLGREAERLARQIAAHDSIASVRVAGVQNHQVRFELTTGVLSRTGQTPGELAREIQSVAVEGTAGYVHPDTIVLPVDVSTVDRDVSSLEEMPVLFSQRQHIARLGEIGRFETAETDRDEPVRVNALPAVSLAAAFHNDAHTFASGKEIRRIMDQFSSTLPHGMEVHLIHFSPDEVQQKLYQKGHLLVQVLALSLIVLVLFVRSCQGGVLAVSLGMTGLLSFLAMRVMGITATPNGLLGMGLAVGFVIPVFYWVQNSFRLDSAGVLSSLKTVEQQNDSSLLQRHWQKWGGSWIATSAVMAGMVSALILLLEQSWAQGLVVIRTVSLMSVISVLLSLTLTPLLMYWVYRAGRLHCFPAPNLLWRLYARSITGMARFRFFLVCAFLALLLVAIKIGMALPYEVAPRSEETVRWLELRAPEGTSQKGMRDIITGIEAFIQNEMVSTPEKEGVGQWLSYLGHALPESDFREIDRLNQLPSRPDTAAFWITFSDPRQVNEQLQLLSHWIKQRYPELQFKNRLPWNRVDDREDSVLTLSGSTEAVLTDASWRVGQRLANQVGVASVWSEWGHYSKRLRLVVDTARSLRAGVTPREIYGLIASHLNGIELFRLADADRTEVVLSQGEHYSRRIDWLENLQVGTAKKGVQMPLSGMVAQQLTWEPSRLVRDGTGQRADFLLRLQPGVNKAQVIDELSALLEAESRYFGGELEYQLHFTDQSVRFVLWPVLPGMLIGLALMLIVMMVRYNAFGKGMMILLAPLPAGMGILLGNTLFSVAINPVALLGIGLVALWCWLVVIGFFECMSWVEGGRKSTHQMVCDGMACDGMEGVSVWLVPVLVSALTLISVCALLYVTGGTMWRPLALSLGSGVLVSAILLPFIVPALSGPLTTGRFFFDNASTNSQ